MKLGAIIAQLEQYPEDEKVVYDFGNFVPNYIDSYRGYYNQLALGYTEDKCWSEYPTVKEILSLLKDAVGKTFTGWKGGEFKMDGNTTVWADNSGNSSSTAITHISHDSCVMIHTENRD